MDYAKRPLWQWILLYLVIGGLVYAAIYYFYFAKKGGYTAPPSAPSQTQTPSSWTIPLSTQNDSGQSGQAVITEENGQLRVVITLTGSPPDSTQPAHIHLGSCPTPGQVQYPLTSLQNGQSETVINSTWSALKSQAMAVNVHKSASEATVYVACGNI